MGVAPAEVRLHEGERVGGEQVRPADERGDHQVHDDDARPQVVHACGTSNNTADPTINESRIGH